MDLKELEKIRVFVSNKFGARNYQEKPVVTPLEVVEWIREWQEKLVKDEVSSGVTQWVAVEDELPPKPFDTSDKAYAKAYSLALKIVLLKVHLLESRDGEEQRDPEVENSYHKKAAPPQQERTYKKVAPEDYVLDMGSLKGKKLGELSLDQLNQVEDFLSTSIKEKKGTEKQRKFYGFVLSQVRLVQKQKEPKDAMDAHDFAPHPESLGMDDFGPPPEEPQGDPLKRLQNKWAPSNE